MSAELEAASQIAQIVEPFGDQGGKAIRNRRERKQEDRRWNRNRKAALDDFNLVNEYNHPKNQMMRLKEAGLNPALIYGDSGAATSQASSISQEDTPRAEMETLGSGIGRAGTNLLALEQMRLTNSNIETQKRLIEAQILSVLANTDKKKLDTQFMMDTYDNMVKAIGISNEEKGANIEMKHQSVLQSQQWVRESTMRMNKLAAETDMVLDENTRRQLMSSLQRNKVDQETKLLVEKTLNAQKERLLIEANTAKTQEEKARITKQAAKIEQEIRILNQTNAKDWTRIGNDIVRTIIQSAK